jgi:ech hydrogenase subunit D
MENQQIITINRTDLVAKATEMKNNGYRMVHVCATTLADSFEITYAFDKDYELVNLRVNLLKSDPVIPSISSLYLCSFAYENELQDLFGLTVTDLVLNYNGNFYKKKIKAPFALKDPKAEAK